MVRHVIKVPELHLGIVQSDAQYKVIVAGRRFGKTQLVEPLCLKHIGKADQFKNRQTGEALPPKIGYYHPTLKEGEETMWSRALKAFKPITAKVDNTRLRITFNEKGHYGTFQIFGTDKDPESLRGAYRTLVIMDEFAYQNEYAWKEVISPMLADVDGEAVFMSTPEGRDLFYDLYERGQDVTQAQYRSWQYTTLQGGYASEKYVEDQKKNHTLEEFQRIYEAQFIGKAGRVYYAFEKSINVTNIYPQEGLDLYWSWDFNQIPCVHSVLGHITGDVVWVFDEICQGETPDTLRTFVERYPPGFFNSITITGDATKIGQTTSGISDYDVMVNFLGQRGYGSIEVKVMSGNPFVRDRTNHVNRLLKDASGQTRMFIDPKCLRLIKDMEKLARSEKTGKIDKIKDPALSHASDALGYLCCTEITVHYSL